MPPPLSPLVLVVDDTLSLLDLFRDVLGREGFEIDTAATATEALDRLATRHYAAIVTDCVLTDLPVLDWLAALHGASGRTPLILCSGQVGRPELLAYAAEFRAVDVLEKPFSIGQLLAAVRGAVETG